MISRPYTFLIVGRSGCGKGTQVKFLAQKYGIGIVLSSGEIFRAMIKADTMAGKKLAEIFERGELPPDWLFIAEVEHAVIDSLKTGDEGIIFDGMLRRPEEAVAICTMLDWYSRRLTPILIDIPEEESMERLLLRGRFDDTPDNIRGRLNWFQTNYMKSIEYLRERYGLVTVDGLGSPEEVFLRIVTALEKDNSVGL